MKNTENQIREAFEKLAPNQFEALLSKSETEKGKEIVMVENKRQKNTLVTGIMALAAALVLFVGGAFGTNLYRVNYRVATQVSLDVNPSIAIHMNQKEKVLEVVPLNEDGKKVIGTMDFKGSSLEVTVNALLGSMLRSGYLNEVANSILVSVEGQDTATNQTVQQHITKVLEEVLQQESFAGAILSQTLQPDESLQSLASAHQMSVGKAKMVQEMVASTGKYTFEDLSDLSIHELNLMQQTAATPLEKLQSSGTASEKAYIGEDAAKEIVLQNLSLTEEQISGYHIEYDWEKGTFVYEMEFFAQGVEYELDINAATGEILKLEKEGKLVEKQPEGNPVQQSPGFLPAEKTQPDNISQSTAVSDTVIGEDSARTIALQHAGLTENAVRKFKCQLDREHGRMVYEIEFEAAGYEYDYEIEAKDGSILKAEKELD